jgi:uncharacterized membrane protein (DUF4010 family)
MNDFPQSTELRVGIALVIGLVIGAEREQRMAEAAQGAAGIRTFAITALLGAVARLIDQPVVLALFGGAVAAGTLIAYALGDRTKGDPGLTSEIALVLTFALGALALSHPLIALAVGITTALLLAFRTHIHDVVREVLSPTELRDALIVAAGALVVMPLVPDRTVDPWNVLNPFVLLRLIVVILAIHLAAHVAQRVMGPRWGLSIAGLAAGFVSSSATVAAMGKKAAEDPAQERSAIAAATASTIATFVQMAVLVGAASASLLLALAIPLAAGGLTALAYAAVFAFRAAREGGTPVDGTRSAVDLKGAVIFAVLVTAVTVGASVIESYAGSSGVVIAAAIAAFADAHAAAASIASVHAAERLASDAAIVAVLACLSTNTVTKTVLAFTSGPRSYALPVLGGLALVIAATWGAWVLQAAISGAL